MMVKNKLDSLKEGLLAVSCKSFNWNFSNMENKKRCYTLEIEYLIIPITADLFTISFTR